MLQDFFKSQVQSKDNGPAEDVVDIGNGLTVRRPPLARTQTQVLGGTDFAKAVEDIFTKVPELRGRVRSIQQGPNLSLINWLGDRNNILDELGSKAERFGPEQFKHLNLTGLTDSDDTSSIAVNPRLDRDTLPLTLGHELGHAVGVEHGPVMEDLHQRLKPVFNVDERWSDNNIMADPMKTLRERKK
jgi:hypothetical protein